MFTTDWLSALDRRFHLTQLCPSASASGQPPAAGRGRTLAVGRPLPDVEDCAPHPPAGRAANDAPCLGRDRDAGQQRDRAGEP